MMAEHLYSQSHSQIHAQNHSQLHSRYNPEKEAERYIENYFNDDARSADVQFCILIECGFCYVIPPLKKMFPGAKIISAHLDGFYADNEVFPADAVWSPDLPISCADFLAREMPDIEASKIKLVEWRPSLAVYGKEYGNLVSTIAAFVRRVDANKRTISGFAKRWHKNTIKNSAMLKNIARLQNTEGACIVSGAGPSLEESMETIRALMRRKTMMLIAVSSAAPAFLSRGIKPDIIVTSDGGAWALCHLRECLRYDLSKTIIAASLNAALPSQCGNLPVLPFGDGSFCQSYLLSCLGADIRVFPQRGTVSAAAIDLALALRKGTVLVTGIDLANDDIKAHVRPYPLDTVLERQSSRLNPYYSLQFKRTRLINNSGSNVVYADWFKEQAKKYPPRVFALGKAAFDIPPFNLDNDING
jgi:hypothetical protein